MVKSTHPGLPCARASKGALLAQAGFLSHESIIEAHQGYVTCSSGLSSTGMPDPPTWVPLSNSSSRFISSVIRAGLYAMGDRSGTDLQQRHRIRAKSTYLELEVRRDLVRRGHEEVRSGLDGKFSSPTVERLHSPRGKWIRLVQ